MRRAPSGLEVFLVRRHDAIAFMGGAYVFPGGRVDAADHRPDAAGWGDGLDGALRMPDMPPDEAAAHAVAAIRELFEEAGILLARDRTGGMLRIDTETAARFERYRHDLAEHAIDIFEIAEREQLRLAPDALRYFAHWVTPAIEAKRFDTRFFAAEAPEGQTAAHDRRETTDGIWIEPAAAIERCLRGEIALPPPTWTTLRAIGRLGAIEPVMEWAGRGTVPRIEPGFIQRGDNRVIILPGDPDFPAVPGFEAQETRFLLENGRWRPTAPD